MRRKQKPAASEACRGKHPRTRVTLSPKELPRPISCLPRNYLSLDVVRGSSPPNLPCFTRSLPGYPYMASPPSSLRPMHSRHGEEQSVRKDRTRYCSSSADVE